MQSELLELMKDLKSMNKCRRDKLLHQIQAIFRRAEIQSINGNRSDRPVKRVRGRGKTGTMLRRAVALFATIWVWQIAECYFWWC